MTQNYIAERTQQGGLGQCLLLWMIGFWWITGWFGKWHPQIIKIDLGTCMKKNYVFDAVTRSRLNWIHNVELDHAQFEFDAMVDMD